MTRSILLLSLLGITTSHACKEAAGSNPDDCLSFLTEIQGETLVATNKSVYCDPACLGGGESLWCNAFGVDQACRLCRLTADTDGGVEEEEGPLCPTTTQDGGGPTATPTTAGEEDDRVYGSPLPVRGSERGDAGVFTLIPSIGTQTAFYKAGECGLPEEVGIRMTGEDTMDPDLLYVWGTLEDGIDYVRLPNEAVLSTPFQAIGSSSSPFGHPGDQYAVPHYDYHFFFWSPLENREQTPQMECTPPMGPPPDVGVNFLCLPDETNAHLFTPDPETNHPRPGPWGVECPDCQAADKYLGYPCLMPESYLPNIAVPHMGMHHVPAKSPDYPDGPPGCDDPDDGVNGWTRMDPCFTHVHLLGTYDAELTFTEIMITVDLMTGLEVGAEPECFPTAIYADTPMSRAGEYPLTYCVSRPEVDVFDFFYKDFVFIDYTLDCPAAAAAAV